MPFNSVTNEVFGLSVLQVTSDLYNPSCVSDTDGDGIANEKDLDSDGDGCSDAFEAGETTSQTANYTFTGKVGLSWRGAMDCFAEPVIGRAFARPVGSQ